MKFRFLMSHRRKNSVRDKVIGKKGIYLERNTLHTQSVGLLRRWEQHQGMGLSVFIGVGNFMLMSGRSIPAILGKGWGFPEIGPPPTFWPLWLALELSWCLGVCHLACWCVTVSVSWGLRSSGSQLVRLPSWTYLVLISLCHVLGLCHPFKGCALPPSLLFH